MHPRAPRLAIALLLTIASSAAQGAIITGTEYGEVLNGTADADTIYGLGGDDEIYGLGGEDTLYGGPNDDWIIGGDVSSVTKNYLYGEDGNDYLEGGDGADLLNGGGGDDEIWGRSGNDTLIGSYGNDDLNGSYGDDKLFGGPGDDELQGEVGKDIVVGGNGSDVFNSHEGNDVFDGGDDDEWHDTAEYNVYINPVHVNLATGKARDGMGFTDQLIDIEIVIGSIQNDVLIGGDPDNDSFEGFSGGEGNDTINGESGYDVWYAGYTSSSSPGIVAELDLHRILDPFGFWDVVRNIEAVEGTEAGDIFRGNGANNTFFAYGGNDVIDGGPGGDTVNFSGIAFAGFSGLTVDLRAGTVSGAGTTSITRVENVVGTHFNDTILGDGKDNILSGGLGSDILTGRGGADIYLFSKRKESGVEILRDRITDFNAGSSDTSVDKIDLSPIDANTNAAGNQAFTFIGKSPFSGVSGQLRKSLSGSTTIVSGDVNGDTVADFEIGLLNFTNLSSLTGIDLIR